jgi:hypothetical protein
VVGWCHCSVSTYGDPYLAPITDRGSKIETTGVGARRHPPTMPGRETTESEASSESTTPAALPVATTTPAVGAPIQVHVAGRVKHPGVYTVNPNARVGTVDTMTAPAGTSVGFERISQTAMTDNATTSNTPTAEAWTRLTVRHSVVPTTTEGMNDDYRDRLEDLIARLPARNLGPRRSATPAEEEPAQEVSPGNLKPGDNTTRRPACYPQARRLVPERVKSLFRDDRYHLRQLGNDLDDLLT